MARLVDWIRSRCKFAISRSFKSRPKRTNFPSRETLKRVVLNLVFQESISISIFMMWISVSPYIRQPLNFDFLSFIMVFLSLSILFLIRLIRPLNPGEFIYKVRKRFGIPLWFVFATTHLVSLFFSRDCSTGNGCFSTAFSALCMFVVAVVRVTANFERDSIWVSRFVLVQTCLAVALQCYNGRYVSALVCVLPVATVLFAFIPCPGSLDYLYCDSADRLPFIFLEWRRYDF